MDPKHIEALAKLNPCDEGAEWFAAQATPQEAWDACTNPDWMLWLLGRTPRVEGDHQRLARVAARAAWAATRKEHCDIIRRHFPAYGG
jgi:hypothetical protein